MKSENRIRAILSWIHTFLLLEGVYILFAGFLGLEIPKSARFAAGGLLLFVPIVTSWYFLRKIRSMWLFLLLGAAVTLLLGFPGLHFYGDFSKSFCFLLTGFLSAVIFLVRCLVRVRRGRIRRMLREMPGNAGEMREPELWELPTIFDEPSPKHFVLFAIYYFAALVLGFHAYLRWLFLLLLTEIPVCFVCRYLESLQDYMEENRAIANLPVKAMRRVSRGILLLLLAGLLLFLLPGILCTDEPLTKIKWDAKDISTTNETMEFVGMDTVDMDKLLADYGIDDASGEAPAWLKAAETALVWVLGVILIAGVLWTVWMALRHASASFSEEDDEVISLDEEESGDFSAAVQKKRRPGWFSPEMRIRRKYKRTVSKNLKTAPAGYETPQELEKKAGLTDENAQTLHALYEKARYSGRACTPEDVKNLP